MIDYDRHYKLQHNTITGQWRITYHDGSFYSHETFNSSRAAQKALDRQIKAMKRAQGANQADDAVAHGWTDAKDCLGIRTRTTRPSATGLPPCECHDFGHPARNCRTHNIRNCTICL